MKRASLILASLRHAFLREPMPLPPGSYWLSLHGSVPDLEAPDATEARYPGYARVAMPLDAAHWTPSYDPDRLAGECMNAVRIEFPWCESGEPVRVSHWCLLTGPGASSPADYAGEFETPFEVAPNRRPTFEPGDLIIEEI